MNWVIRWFCFSFLNWITSNGPILAPNVVQFPKSKKVLASSYPERWPLLTLGTVASVIRKSSLCLQISHVSPLLLFIPSTVGPLVNVSLRTESSGLVFIFLSPSFKISPGIVCQDNIASAACAQDPTTLQAWGVWPQISAYRVCSLLS